MGPCLYSHMTLWSRSLDKLGENINLLHLHYHCLWPQNLPSWCLVIGASTYDVTSPFGHLVARDHMMTCLDCLLPITSSKHIITWFCEILKQTKKISATKMSLATKLGRVMTLSAFYPQSHMTIQSRGLVRLRDKLK